jgi:hypothetical protein
MGLHWRISRHIIKKTHRSSTYAKKSGKNKQTTSHVPLQIADFQSQRIKPRLMRGSILCNIFIARSQLWRRSRTLEWTVRATTLPKLASESSRVVKNLPRHPILLMQYHRNDATINLIALPPSKQGDLTTPLLSQRPHLDALSHICEGGGSWWSFFFSTHPTARKLVFHKKNPFTLLRILSNHNNIPLHSLPSPQLH